MATPNIVLPLAEHNINNVCGGLRSPSAF